MELLQNNFIIKAKTSTRKNCTVKKSLVTTQHELVLVTFNDESEKIQDFTFI